MKRYSGILVAGLLATLAISSCKKDKPVRGEEPQGQKITMTKAADDNSDWKLNIDDAAANRAEIWVDLNNNGSKDNGQAFAEFGMDISDPNIFPLGESKTIAIYGKVTKLGCAINELTALDLTKNTELQELDCAANRLTALGISENTLLEVLDCSFNELTTLDLSRNTALQSLNCNYNDLAKLNLSQNKVLISLDCLKNRLTTLNLSQNVLLERLVCYNNLLTTPDLSQNEAIKMVDLSRNLLTGTNMQQLLTNLPQRTAASKGELYLLYPPNGQHNARHFRHIGRQDKKLDIVRMA